MRRHLHALAPVLVGVTIAVTAGPAPGSRAVSAQTRDACSLLTPDEIQTLVPKDHATGTATAIPPADFTMCRYAWGVGIERVSVVVTVSPASPAYAGQGPDAIKKEFVASVVPDTSDTVVPDVGDAAVFKSISPAYAIASAYVKGRLLQVYFDGLDAADQKPQLISVMKAAAARLP